MARRLSRARNNASARLCDKVEDDLAAELGGRLKISGLVGGTRCIVVGPPPRDRPCSMLREDEVSRYLELTPPLAPTSRAGEEEGAIAKRAAAARRRLAAGITLG